jgi:hypothetical protein
MQSGGRLDGETGHEVARRDKMETQKSRLNVGDKVVFVRWNLQGVITDIDVDGAIAISNEDGVHFFASSAGIEKIEE